MENVDKIKMLMEMKNYETLTDYYARISGGRGICNFISEIKGSTTNDRPMVRLDETSVQRLLGKHSDSGYIVISASRGAANPGQEQEQREINNKNYKILLEEIKNSGFSFIPVYGGFIENYGKKDDDGNSLEKQVYEKSFIVLNYNRKGEEMDINELYRLGLKWSNQFNQDSFLFKAPNSTPEYVTKTGDVEMKFTDSVKINDMTQEYFTDFIKSRKLGGDEYSREHRFTYEGVYINPSPATYSERHVRHMLNEVFLTN